MKEKFNNDSENNLYYMENGLVVFTEAYHLKRGYCCRSGCRHCPYDYKKERDDKKKKVTISWSGGKDSAFALYRILLSREFEVVNLHTVINEESKRVGMHGTREELIEMQAQAIGIPLIKLYLETTENHVAYEKVISTFYHQCAEQGIHAAVFGDIFLEDLKQFRENLLQPSNLKGIFPLWKLNTSVLVNDFINSGFKTLVCAADERYFSSEQVGETITDEFMQKLSPQVDWCGENGEFHTFVYEGPIFRNNISFRFGDKIKKTYRFQKQSDDGSLENIESAFWFQDLLPLTA